PCYELGGPRSFTYAELLRNITDRIGVRARLLPVPFPLWHATALVSEEILGATLTRSQIALMRRDNVASQKQPGPQNLNIAPTALEDVVRSVAEGIAAHHRKGGLDGAATTKSTYRNLDRILFCGTLVPIGRCATSASRLSAGCSAWGDLWCKA